MMTKNENGPKDKKQNISNDEQENIPVVNTNEEEDTDEDDDDGDYEILPSNDAGITMDDNAYTGEPHQREGD